MKEERRVEVVGRELGMNDANVKELAPACRSKFGKEGTSLRTMSATTCYWCVRPAVSLVTKDSLRQRQTLDRKCCSHDGAFGLQVWEGTLSPSFPEKKKRA